VRPPDFLAIVGPTASGKSELGVAVARRLDGEIVSMDSRQVYRGMDVGTAKLGVAERAGVPHHGLDLIDPDESYSAVRFARDARRFIEEIRARGRVPILVGGTGFFLRALTEPIFGEPELDPGRRRALRAWMATQSNVHLSSWVRRLDPDRAELAVQGGPQRLARTLEVALLSGRPLSWWHRHSAPEADALTGVIVRLTLPRDELDRRIARRTRGMLDAGLVAEVEGLIEHGYGPDAPGMTGVGYREIALQLAGEIDPDEAEERIRRATRAYARRQSTWFRHQLPDDTLVVDATDPLDQRIERVAGAWREACAVAPKTRGAVG
jgi:tRNA dimethylallyltransferase